MNLSRLFDTQEALEARILESHPELQGQDNLNWKVLALQVELGECANEWRGFKKWSNDRKPRNGQNEMGKPIGANKVLEEYVDCLHLVLSIGLEIGIATYTINENLSKPERYGDKSIIKRFSGLISSINTLVMVRAFMRTQVYYSIFDDFIKLGYQLGYTWEQIEQAYYAKNKINHQRQESGY